MDRPPHSQTARDVLRETCGLVLSNRFGRLGREEQEGVLKPHRATLKRGGGALDQLLRGAYDAGVAAAHHHLRSADAFDPDAVDEVMVSKLEPDPDAVPVEVPGRPWPGSLRCRE